jgi:hypothetical protein
MTRLAKIVAALITGTMVIGSALAGQITYTPSG